MLKIDMSQLFRTTERNWASDVTTTKEGVALAAVYEGGVMMVKPSVGAANEIFCGVAFSSRTTLTEIAYAGTLTAVGTLLALPHTPVPTTINIAGLIEDTDYTVSGSNVTVIAAHANKTLEVMFQYVPSVLEALSLQGDVEPGTHQTLTLRKTGVIESGEVFTTEFDTAADWSGVPVIRLGSNGMFTTAGSGAIVNCLVTNIPGAGRPYLGLSYSL